MTDNVTVSPDGKSSTYHYGGKSPVVERPKSENYTPPRPATTPGTLAYRLWFEDGVGWHFECETERGTFARLNRDMYAVYEGVAAQFVESLRRWLHHDRDHAAIRMLEMDI